MSNYQHKDPKNSNWKHFGDKNHFEKVLVPNWSGRGIGRRATFKQEDKYLLISGRPFYTIVECIIIGYVENKKHPKEFIALQLGDKNDLWAATTENLWRDIERSCLIGKHYVMSKKKFFNICSKNTAERIMIAPAKKFDVISLKDSYLNSSFSELYDK